MPEETSGQGNPPEDELDRKLRELTENRLGEAKYKELTAGVVAIVVLAAIGGVAWLRFGHSQAGTAAGVSSGAGLGTGGSPPADPFVGSEAGTWADGASGITVPAAKPAGTFTAAQVKAAYETTRKLLIAANLNQQTLRGGAPAAFAGLLAKQQRAAFLAGLNTKGVNKGGYPLSTRKWVASFAPGSADFIGNVIKVHGTMSAHSAKEAGGVVLAVQVDYLFAYAVEPPGRPGDWMRVIDHQYGNVNFAQWDDPGGPLEPADQTIIGNAGIVCGTDDGYIHPAYPSERSAGGTVCGRTSGT
jgi:hypothetical protein